VDRKIYFSFLSEVPGRRQRQSKPGPGELAYIRLSHFAVGFVLFIVWAASVASGATDPSGSKSDAGAVEPATASAINYQWNMDNRQFPLLSFFSEQLKPGLDQSLSFPMDQFRFLIFETLDYYADQHKYLLPSISHDSGGVHFIEFKSNQSKRTFVANVDDGLELTDGGAQKTIRAGNGTTYVFVKFSDGQFRCALINDVQHNRLNFIYASNGLSLRALVDSAGRTITFNYTDDEITSITQTWRANTAGLQKTWTVGQRLAGMSAALSVSVADRVPTLKKVPSNALVREYTAAMADSDKLLAEIFGGPNAVAAGNGFEPPGLAASYPLYRGDVRGDDGRVRRGHLSYAVHLYGNANGTGDSPIYLPAGFTLHSGPPSPTDAAVTFYYPKLGNLTDITIAVFHVADFEIYSEGQRVRIGNIGGMGGSSPLYKHSHIEFYRGNTGLPPAEARMELRVDPAVVANTIQLKTKY
jgi:hypothetical protein